MSRFLYLIAVLFMIASAAGCSPAGRSSLSGTVTLGGVPLTQGTLSFSPTGSTETTAPTGALIKDGKYSIESVPGIAPGTYKVTANSVENTNEGNVSVLSMKSTAKLKVQDRVPESWNKSGLTVEIKPGKNIFNVEIPAK